MPVWSWLSLDAHLVALNFDERYIVSNIINPADFKTKVTELVVNSFGSIIPPETLQQLIDEQIKAFFEEPTSLQFSSVTHSYSSHVTSLKAPMTPFRALVWTQVSTLVKRELESYLMRPDSTLQQLVRDMVKASPIEGATLTLAQHLSIQMASSLMASVVAQAATQATATVANNALTVPDPNFFKFGNDLMRAPQS